MASMKTLGRQLSTKRLSLPFATLACACLPALTSCILQPRESTASAANGAATPAASAKKRVAERWQAVGGGMLGVAADTKGSKGTWNLDGGPKPGQRSLLIEYDLKPGGFVGAWHTTTNLNLAKADGLRFMAKADPPGMVMMSMTDANEVSYVTNFQIP